MCLSSQTIKGLTEWNWDGDIIIHDSVVPASRWVIGYPEKREYSIDVREFLISDKNELIKCTLQEQLKKFIASASGSWDLFSSLRPNSFDYRVDMIPAWVSEHIRYKERG